ncbi:MAG: dual specificity protein phosphatase family protein [Gemmataceae bacterium]|nr:dual specificity protein phosphatase family protein [Gemmataceae bacterium]
MDWITDTIAIGNIEDAMDPEGLREAGISGVLCLNGFPQALRFHGFEWVHVPLIDGQGNSVEDLAAAMRHLRELAEAHRVLVHCAEGVSRSPFVVACHLAAVRKVSFADALQEVKQRRAVAMVDRNLLALLAEAQWPEMHPIEHP